VRVIDANDAPVSVAVRLGDQRGVNAAVRDLVVCGSESRAASI